MATASIPVDLFNPGQVFACLGFLEAAEVLLGDVKGGFDWVDAANPRFILRVEGKSDPVEAVLLFLSEAKVHSVAPVNSDLSTQRWDVPTRKQSLEQPFPFPIPGSPATLPVVLEGPFSGTGTKQVPMEHWGENRELTSRDNVKFWAGAGGYPGAALAKDALELVCGLCTQVAKAPFDLVVPQTSSFRFDWRRDYIPLDIGFSLNNHSDGRFVTAGYPLVEILAAIGLQNARPQRLSKLQYRYGVLGVRGESDLFDVSLLRASLGAPDLPFPSRRFRIQLGWPGKENQARCITTVTEEFT